MSQVENLNATAKKWDLNGNYEDQPDGYEYVPVYIDKSPECKLNSLHKKKFLISAELKVVHMQFKIRKLLNIPLEKCLFLYTNNYRVWEASTTFGELYEHYNRKLIHIKYTDENLYATEICGK